VQDLIAITRVLADGRDTLALGALLRGPLVGLTEEELLDVVWALPRAPEHPDSLPRLNVFVDLDHVTHPLARETLGILQSLRRRSNSTTPHDLLSQAVEELRVRPILLRRHGGHAERAASNVDLYLSFARPYAIRGLRAFAEAMTAAWTEKDKAVEGRPDAREEAVALHTMHAAKGLEWPVVVPINTMTTIVSRDSSVTDRLTGRHYNSVFGVAPAGHAERKALEDAELGRERVRLWYVAATRAQELLILPRPDVEGPSKAWNGIVDLALGTLTSLDLSAFSTDVGAPVASVANAQTREVFAGEAAALRAMNTRINWVAPSRDEGAKSDAPSAPGKTLFGDDDLNPDDAPPFVQGGLARGLVMHKLFEEVLTGETQEFELAARASVLIVELGETVCANPAKGLNGAEIAGCVVRTLAIPEIAVLRPGLQPELPVASCKTLDDAEWATAGIGDAIHIGSLGYPFNRSSA
jgi:exodeoxyribonuclease-5